MTPVDSLSENWSNMRLNLNTLLAADHKIMRLINRMNVLDIIREQSPISRVRIARLTGLRKPTISSIVTELINEGLVYEDSPESSSVGRRAISLQFNHSCRVYGVVNVSRRETLIAVCDLSGRVLNSMTVPTLCGRGREFFVQCAQELSRMLEIIARPAAGIGIITPCSVNPREGKIFCDRQFDWKELNLCSLFENYFDLPIHVENDARAAALGELWFAPEIRGVSSFVFLLVSGGLRCGTVIGNGLYHGANFRDGRFESGAERVIGRTEYVSTDNCFESRASDLGVVSLYCRLAGIQNAGSGESFFDRILELANNGDQMAIRAFRETAAYLATAVSFIRRSLDPERIVIGGRLVRAWNLIYPELVRIGMDTDDPVRGPGTAGLVVPSSLAESSLEGARALVLRSWLNSMNPGAQRRSRLGTGVRDQLQGAVGI